MGMPFYKAFSDGILRGSLAASNNTTQLIWLKMLAMANETRDRDGYLRYSKGHPYTNKYIATVCHVTMDELEIAIDEFKKDIRDGLPRIVFADDGSILLSNFVKYQAKPIKEPKPPMSPEQKQAMINREINKNPEPFREALRKNWDETVVSNKGEILN